MCPHHLKTWLHSGRGLTPQKNCSLTESPYIHSTLSGRRGLVSRELCLSLSVRLMMHVIWIELSMESHFKKTIATVQLKRSYASKQRFTHAVFWYRKLGNLSYFLLTLVPWLMCLSDNHANVTQPWKTLLSRRTVQGSQLAGSVEIKRGWIISKSSYWPYSTGNSS